MIREASKADYNAMISGQAPTDLRLADTEVAPQPIISMLSNVADEVRAEFSPTSWLIMNDGELVSLCSIVKPPRCGVVELGYGIAPSRRRQGHASSAVAEIAEWARARPDVTALVAETTHDNPGSQSVLVSNGFSRTGERVDDEDGPLICWRLDT